MLIHLEIDKNPERITFNLTTQAVLGRADEEPVEIDLTPYHAAEKGVSRRHAIIALDGRILTLMDFNSVGGTFLNGERLKPLRPVPLHSGDDIRMGAMSIRIFFEYDPDESLMELDESILNLPIKRHN